MGEKVYKPIVKEGNHLLRSKDNPDRVRGLTRDENNRNQDIIEWEEYDADDLRSDDTQLIREALGIVIVAGGTLLFDKVISPWWKNSAWPWLKEKGCSIKDTVGGRKEQKNTVATKGTVPDRYLAEVSLQIDNVFEQFYFEMDEDEAKAHIMQLVYHILGVANEIRVISNARIRKECESEKLCIERRNEAEKLLSERVVAGLDRLLSNEKLQLDLETSRELFSLTGGGIRCNGEYVPVQAGKIDEALKIIPTSDS